MIQVHYGPPSESSLEILEILRKAVADELEKKRRLGQYVVVWKDGRPVAIGDDAPEDLKWSVDKC